MEFQLSCLKFLTNEAVNMLYSICQQIWKAHQWPQCWKRSVFIPMQKKGNSYECSTYPAIVLISLASKVMLNILQAKFQQYMNWELPNIQTGLSNQRSNCQHSLDHRESKGIPEKTFPSASLTMLKTFTVWTTTNCGKFLRNGSTRSTYLFPNKSVCRSKSSR